MVLRHVDLRGKETNVGSFFFNEGKCGKSIQHSFSALIPLRNFFLVRILIDLFQW